MSLSTSLPPILVSGCSRSGTTWVGSTIALSNKTQYIYEPFNIDISSAGLAFPHQFMHLCAENELQYIHRIKRFLDRESRVRSIKQFFSPKSRALLKDPLAFFSVPWLAQNLGCQVVITVRHPAAVVSSRQKLGWRFDFSHLLAQPLLMQHYLMPFKETIEKYVAEDHDVLDESILLWKIIYHVAKQYREEHPDWLFVRHEDLCRDPMEQFQSLFEHLNLKYDTSIQSKIINSTSQNNPIEPANAEQHNLTRNSNELSKVWKQRLSEQQVDYIRQCVQPIADEFYSEDDWS